MNENQKVIKPSLVGSVESSHENEAVRLESVESGRVMLEIDDPPTLNSVDEGNEKSADYKDGASQSIPGSSSSQPSVIQRSIAKENRRKNRLSDQDMMRGSKTVKPGSNGSEVCKTTDVVKGIGEELKLQEIEDQLESLGACSEAIPSTSSSASTSAGNQRENRGSTSNGSPQKPGSSSPTPRVYQDYLHPRYKHWPHLTVNGYPRREKEPKRKCSLYCSNCGAAGHHEEGYCDATLEEIRWYQLSQDKDSTFEKTKQRVEKNLQSQGVYLSSQTIGKLSPAETKRKLFVIMQYTQRAINYLAIKGYQRRVKILVSVLNFRMQILRERDLDGPTWKILFESLFDFVDKFCDKI